MSNSEEDKLSQEPLAGNRKAGCLETLFAKPHYENKQELPKIFGLYQLVVFGVANTIGSGAYSMIGITCATTGPVFIFSFMLLGVLCWFISMPFAEFSSTFPSAGFSYFYVSASCGELIGFLAGAQAFTSYILASAICARCLALYIVKACSLYGLHIPEWISDYPFLGLKFNFLGCLIVVVMCVILLSGLRKSTWVGRITTSINVFVLVFAVIVGLFCITKDQLKENYNSKSLLPALTALGMAYYAFLGFETVTAYTEEATNPQRDVPWAFAILLVIATLVYCGLVVIMTGMVPLHRLKQGNALAEAFGQHHMNWVSLLISIGSMSAFTSTIQACFMASPRILYSMSSTGSLPKIFGQVNPKTEVIEVATIFACTVAATLTLTIEVEALGYLAALGGIVSTGLVDVSLIVRRYRHGSRAGWVNLSCIFYVLLAMLCGILIHDDYVRYCWAPCIGMVMIYLFVKSQPNDAPKKGFVCPAVPLVPFIGVATCFVMAGTIDLRLWLHGFGCYFFAIGLYLLTRFYLYPKFVSSQSDPLADLGHDPAKNNELINFPLAHNPNS